MLLVYFRDHGLSVYKKNRVRKGQKKQLNFFKKQTSSTKMK